MAATVPAEPVVPARRTRLGSVRRGFAPVSDARGMTRTMLFLGAAITLAFVLIAFLAPVIGGVVDLTASRSTSSSRARSMVISSVTTRPAFPGVSITPPFATNDV